MAADYDKAFRDAVWAKNNAIRTFDTLNNLTPRHVYLITLKNGNRMLAFPRAYGRAGIKFEALAKDQNFNAGNFSDDFCLRYVMLSNPDSMSFKRVPKSELPLYITMEKVYPGLEKAMKGRIHIEED